MSGNESGGGIWMKHLVSMNDLSKEQILTILNHAESFASGEKWQPKNKMFATNLFFEPSTRTKTSFEMAERKLGIEVIPFEIGSCSLLKGETLYDTIKTLEAIGVNTAVIRHGEEAYYQDFIDQLNISLINAGDGCGQHPTQSLLDLFTIKQEFGEFSGLKVAIIGDLTHSRVAKSNHRALSALGAEVIYSGPPQWFDSNQLSSNFCEIDDAVETADVVMLLRIQHERHDSTSFMTAQEYHSKYGLTIEREKRMKKDSIIMHPAPVNRNVEIADSLVECEKSRIFKQMENGVFTRMAVLRSTLEQ